MMISHEFVDFIPDKIQNEKIYISIKYKTAIHKCACGCNSEVVTPISPTDWAIKYNGETISLYPSIGNWSYNCRSHYWIKNSQIIWSNDFSNEKVEDIRRNDRNQKEDYYKNKNSNLFVKIIENIKKIFK